MKTLDQICRYTLDFNFPDRDWERILSYCRKNYKGGQIHRAVRRQRESTYKEFIDWIENKPGYGDIVRYGNTIGVMGLNIPGDVHLCAYLDFEGNLIVRDMKIMDEDRITVADTDESEAFRKTMYSNGLDYYVRLGRVDKLYTPEKNFYVVLGKDDNGRNKVGIYLESVDNRAHFIGFLDGKEFKMDCWVDTDCTPFKPAANEDILRLHEAAAKRGYSYNERLHQFVLAPKRGGNNAYWYLNDRFQVVMDRDNGGKTHAERYEAGNYFIDGQEAMTFMREIRKMRGKA